MSTRAQITVKTDAGFRSVYLHHDGYPEHALETLRAHYATPELAAELVSYGDMSVLAERCDGGEGHSSATPKPGQTVYYGRDCGEADVAPRYTEHFESIKMGEEFRYLFDGEWREVD